MAIADWQLVEPSTELIPIEINFDNNYLFKFPSLDEYFRDDMSGFVAWGPDFLNFQRFELFGEFKKRGIKMPPLIHPSAVVSRSAIIQENVWINALSYIGINSIIELNSCISIASTIGSNVTIGKNVWIGEAVSIQNGVQIGSNSILGQGISVFSKVKVGHQVRFELASNIENDIPDKSFHIHSSNLIGQILKI
jgi:acetyltransferase-like isoleucine patch superfamily enzyme